MDQNRPDDNTLLINYPTKVNGVKKSPAPQMRQILDNNATINVQKSHSVPNVNGHMQNQGRQQNSNKNNGNACPDHNEINEGTKKFSFNSADGDDPGMFSQG